MCILVLIFSIIILFSPNHISVSITSFLLVCVYLLVAYLMKLHDTYLDFCHFYYSSSCLIQFLKNNTF